MHCEWQLNYKQYKTTDLKIYIYNRFYIFVVQYAHTVVAKIVRAPDKSENIDLFCLQNIIYFHNFHETCR